MSKRRKTGKFEVFEDNQFLAFQIDVVKILDVEELLFHLPVSYDLEENENKWRELYEGERYEEIIKRIENQVSMKYGISCANKTKIQSHVLFKCFKVVPRKKWSTIYQKYLMKGARHSISPSELSNSSLLSEIIFSFLKKETHLEKQKNEEDNIHEAGETLEEICSEIEFVEICGKIIPIELTSTILSYHDRNFEVLVDIGGVCKLFYLIILSTWNHSNISSSNLHTLSLLALRNSRSITIRKNTQIREFGWVWKKLDMNRRLRILEIDRLSISKIIKSILSSKKYIHIFQNVTVLSLLNGFSSLSGLSESAIEFHNVFPNVRCLKGCSKTDDKRLENILHNSNKISKLDFLSKFFFIIPKERSSLGSLQHTFTDNNYLWCVSVSKSPWVVSNDKNGGNIIDNYSMITSLVFDEIRHLHHPWMKKPFYHFLRQPYYSNTDDEKLKRLVILDVFSKSVKDIRLDIFGGICHCKKNVFFFMDRLPNLENVAIRSFPGVAGPSTEYQLRWDCNDERIHFCSNIKYIDECIVKKLKKFEIESKCNIVDFRTKKFKCGRIYTGLIDFNLRDMLSNNFFENLNIQNFRGVLPLLRGRVTELKPPKKGVRKLRRFTEKRIREIRSSAADLMKFVKILTDGVIFSQFHSFDLTLRTRDTCLFKEESLRIKFDDRNQNSVKILRIVYKNIGSRKDDSQEFDFFEEQVLSSKKEKKEKKKKNELSDKVEKSERPLKCLFHLFISKAIKDMVKKNLVDLFVFRVSGDDNEQNEEMKWKRYIQKIVFGESSEGIFEGFSFDMNDFVLGRIM